MLVYFRRDWLAMIVSLFQKSDPMNPNFRRRELLYVVIGCIPAAAVALKFDKHFKQFSDPHAMHSAPFYIAIFVAAGALLLWAAERVGKRRYDLKHLGPFDAVVIGLCQALALFPGFSRSGSSIAGGLFMGLTREDAARFSFLMSAPLIAAACAKSLLDLHKSGIPHSELVGIICGIVAAAVSGYLCIGVLLSYLRRNSSMLFVYYRYALAAAIVAIYLFRG